MRDAEQPWGTDEPGGEGEGGPVAPDILQHTAEVEEALRTSFLPANPSVGGASPLSCSSI